MADETLRFDIVGDDNLSEPLNRAGASAGNLSRHMDAAARSAAILDEALKRQNTASRVSVDATLALARADKILEDAEHGLRDGALEAEFALKKQAEAAKKSGDAADKAAAQNKGLQASLQKIADSAKGGGGPAWLGPALALTPAAGTILGVAAGATIGIAGAAAAGAGALAAFGAVAKPVLADALKAEQAVNTAQNNYTAAIQAGVNPAKAYKAEQLAIAKAYVEMSPQQIALSKQLGNMAQAWQDLKAAQTPVVAGALQPWLKSVTDLTKNLAPIIAKISPVIRDLGVQFGALVNSPAFTAFRNFIANTGSAAVGAFGGTLIDFVKSFMILLPQFNPLIQKTIEWIGDLGPAVLKWASSKKTADDITKFMAWFSTNGPVVGDLLKNIGAALKTLAPGLTAGGVAELKVISDFFGWVARLPKGLAGPLAETAGALLLLNKLGVFSVGVKFVGPAAKWLSGGLINIGGGVTAGAEIRAAMVSGGAAAAAEIRAAMAGGAVPGAAAGGAGAAKAGGAAGLGAAAGELLGIISLAALAGTAIGEIFSKITTGKFENFNQWKVKFLSSLDSMRHAAASFGDGVVQDWNLVWANTITRTAKGFHDLAGWFDTGRHDIAARMSQIMSNVIDAWNKIWNNTIARIQRGFHDTAGLFDTGRHTIAATFDNIRHDIAAKWDQIWSDTASKVRAGIASVVTFFTGLPGKITGVLGNALTVLKNWGAGVITGLLQGMTSVITQVWDFIKSIPGKILSFLGIKSPPQWAIDAGKHIMNGLGIGMNQAQAVFTKASAASAKAAGAAAAGALGTGGVSNASGVAALKSAAAKHGWTSAAEWAALNNVEMREAGYNLTAKNPSSGAYGMAQFINGPSEYAQYGGNSTTYAGQATAMANYIAQRYGDPIAAWAHEQQYGWYDRGGWLPQGLSLALNTSGRPERVISGSGELDAHQKHVLHEEHLHHLHEEHLAELRALRAELRNLNNTAAAIPRATGQHVAGAVNGAAAAAGFRVRYP